MQKQEIESEERGRFALVTSTNGIDSYGVFSAPYDASKAANNNMVRNIGEYLHREHDILVDGLAPGWIETDLNKTLPPEERIKESAKIWCKRFAEPSEIAIHLAFLLTAPYLSGRVNMVDGGYR
jgi:3-oxoacyl-[acyl-carrier protein] reductase